MGQDSQTASTEPAARPRWQKFLNLLPVVWLALLGLTQLGLIHLSDATPTLNETAAWIERFQKDQHRLPWSLAEIRLYAKSYESPYTPYDSFGLRLQYLPLRENSYLLKSFSSDAMENTYGSEADEQFLHGIPAAKQAAKATPLNKSLPVIYQGAFLEGLEAPTSKLIARLEVNPLLRTRYLFVQDPSDASFSMVSFHDAVEEFLWLPSGHEIVYTAQGSDRYEDGIFYWNLKDGSIHNIFNKMKSDFWPEAGPEASFYLSLSHISEDPKLLYVLVKPAGKFGLAPADFYRFSNLFAIGIEPEFIQNPTFQRVSSGVDYSAFDYSISHLALLDPSAPGDPTQEEWKTLSLSGDAEGLIDQWQNFSSKHAQSPLFPYSLWWLASIYNDTFRQFLEDGHEEAHVIRNFGIEIAEALAVLPTAPLHLRAMAEFLKKNLLLSRVADYNVCSLRPSILP